MAQSRKLIKMRIRSVRNTRKITKAMELVAASKMRRAVANALRARSYTSTAQKIVAALASANGDIAHPLFAAKKGASRHMLVFFSSERGLAGGFNVNVFKLARERLREFPEGTVDVVAIGRRGETSMLRLGANVVASFPGLANVPQFLDIAPIARMAIDGFLGGEYADVTLVSTDYVSGISQKPTSIVVLPAARIHGKPESTARATSFLFEPSPTVVLDAALVRIIEAFFFQALLESTASEHAARMVAMKSATDSATEMLDALTFTYNQARQAAITQEIAEISSGTMALA